MPVIDCHVHLNNYDQINKTEKNSLSLEQRLDSLIQSMHNSNIGYCIVLSSYKVDADRPSTSDIIDVTKRFGDKLGVVAGFTIDNHNDEDLKNCRKWLKDGIIKGIKLYCGYERYYPYDERYQKVYDLCIEYHCPLMIHTGDVFSKTAKLKYSHPLNIDDVAVDNPDLKIIMCHLGNPWLIDCQEILYKNRNVFADISGLTVGNFTPANEIHYKNKIKELLDYLPEQHSLLYGTDWPISNMNSYIDLVKKLELNQEALQLLMFKNAKTLFGLS
jgi:predicted TIM-barrel fold metal-dependent hydrolase